MLYYLQCIDHCGITIIFIDSKFLVYVSNVYLMFLFRSVCIYVCLFNIKKIYINAPSDLPLLLLSILVQFEQFFLLFGLPDNKVIVFVCPTLVRFHVLYKKVNYC